MLLVFWALATNVFAQPGSLDHTFGGGDGIVTFPFASGAHAVPEKIAVQPDGKIVVAGGSWIPGDTTPEVIALARLRPDGAFDPGFNGTGRVSIALPQYGISMSDLAILPDGKILLCGGAWKGNDNYFAVVRLTSNGTPDPSFDGDGFFIKSMGTEYQWAYSLAVQPDGKILVGGYTSVNNVSKSVIIRLQSNGAMDNSFGSSGVAITDFGGQVSQFNSIKLQPDGKILAAGYSKSNGKEDFAAARFNPNGTPDNSFGNNGKKTYSLSGFSDNVFQTLLQPDGKILLAGYSGYGQLGDGMMAVMRLNSNGAPDASFGNAGISTINITANFDGARTAVLQPNGKILLAGYSQNYYSDNYYHCAIARLNSDGSPDLQFGAGNGYAVAVVSTTGDFSYSMCLAPDGGALCAGAAWVNNLNQFGVAKFVTGITTDTSTPGKQIETASVCPNPVAQEATLNYSLKEPQTVTVDLFEMSGKFLENLLPATSQSAGNQTLAVRLPDGLPAGVYMLSLRAGTENQNFSIIH